MEITQAEWKKFNKEQIGKPCETHGTIIKKGRYGNWCGMKDKFGGWCSGNSYPHDPSQGALIIKSE